MKLIFGEALEAEPAPKRDPSEHARMGWLYALHARSAVHRGRVLQADLMLTNWRERIMALAAIRSGVNPHHAREAHRLPSELQAALAQARPRSLDHDDLLSALATTADLYLTELAEHDADYVRRLRPAIEELAGSARR